MITSPSADLVTGGWVTGLLYQKIDELSPDSSDYIISSGRPHYDFSQVRLSGFTTSPTGRENFLIKSQYNKWPYNREIVDLKVSLHDGETYIYEGTAPNLATGWITGGMYVPRDNTERITGFNDLRLGFTAISDSLNSGLVSYWKLNETGGTRFDSYGTNNLISNNQISYETGRQDYGAYFVSGTGQYLSISSNNTLQFGSGDNFTLAGWVNLKNLSPNNSSSTVIASKLGPNSNIEEYAFLYNDKLGFGFGLGSGNIRNITYSNNTYNTSTGNWFFVVGQHDTVNLRQWIRVNSTLDIQSGSSAGFGVIDTGTFIIGQDIKSGATQHTGIIDEVAIWNRLLSTGEIDRLYNSRQGSTGPFSGSTLNDGLVGYWPLSETGNIKKDLVGGNHLTHVGFIGTGTGLFGQVTFYGSNLDNTGYLIMNNSSFPREYETPSFTVTCWYNPINWYGNKPIVGRYQGGIGSGWFLHNNSNGRLQLDYIRKSGSSSALSPITPGNLNKWNLAIASFQNGQVLCRNNDDSNTVSSSMVPVSDQIKIGYNFYSDIGNYSGQLADIGLWNRALTSPEMDELYNRGAGRTYPFLKNSLHDDLVAYWKLDETSGTRYASVGTGDLIKVNTVGAVTGKRGNCAYFIRENEATLEVSGANYMSLPETGGFTFAFWHYHNRTGINQGLFSHDENDGLRSYLCTLPSHNLLSFGRPTENSTSFDSFTPFITTGRWYFSCFIRNISNSKLERYSNGAYISDVSMTGKLYLTSGTFVFGRAEGNFLSAFIDEFGYWKRELSSGEIAYLYNNGAGRTWPFV